MDPFLGRVARLLAQSFSMQEGTGALRYPSLVWSEGGANVVLSIGTFLVEPVHANLPLLCFSYNPDACWIDLCGRFQVDLSDARVCHSPHLFVRFMHVSTVHGHTVAGHPGVCGTHPWTALPILLLVSHLSFQSNDGLSTVLPAKRSHERSGTGTGPLGFGLRASQRSRCVLRIFRLEISIVVSRCTRVWIRHPWVWCHTIRDEPPGIRTHYVAMDRKSKLNDMADMLLNDDEEDEVRPGRRRKRTLLVDKRRSTLG